MSISPLKLWYWKQSTKCNNMKKLFSVGYDNKDLLLMEWFDVCGFFEYYLGSKTNHGVDSKSTF